MSSSVGKDATCRCIHASAWTISNTSCAKGVKRTIPMLSRICDDPNSAECSHAAYPTQQEANMKAEVRQERFLYSLALFAKGLSFCCEAPLDDNQTIQSGEHKGHGPRTCSKCGALALYV